MKVRGERYRFSLGPALLILATWPWMNTLLEGWGYRPYRGWGILLGLGILGALLGPYGGLLVLNRGGGAVWSHAAGAGGTLLGFGLGWGLDKLVEKRRS